MNCHLHKVICSIETQILIKVNSVYIVYEMMNIIDAINNGLRTYCLLKNLFSVLKKTHGILCVDIIQSVWPRTWNVIPIHTYCHEKQIQGQTHEHTQQKSTDITHNNHTTKQLLTCNWLNSFRAWGPKHTQQSFIVNIIIDECSHHRIQVTTIVIVKHN